MLMCMRRGICMIEPISYNYASISGLNFKGQENNNFKGITSSLPENNASNLSTREAYNMAVNNVDKTQKEFMAPQGVGENLNLIG